MTSDERISTTDVCYACGKTRIEHGTGSPEYMLTCPGETCPGKTGYQSHYRRGFGPAPARPLPPAVDEFPVRARTPGPPPVCPSPGSTEAAQLDAARASTAALGAVVAGLGKDAPTTTNAAGGRQSATPYRCDLLPPFAVLAVAEVLAHGAAKYGPNNWHKITIAEHLNHALGHVFAALAGDTSDDHLEHAACRVLFALDQRRSGREGGAE